MSGSLLNSTASSSVRARAESSLCLVNPSCLCSTADDPWAGCCCYCSCRCWSRKKPVPPDLWQWSSRRQEIAPCPLPRSLSLISHAVYFNGNGLRVILMTGPKKRIILRSPSAPRCAVRAAPVPKKQQEDSLGSFPPFPCFFQAPPGHT